MTKPDLHFLSLSKHSIYDQLQIEEALLRTDHRNWCIINQGTSPAIVMGISGNPDLLIDIKLQQQKKIPVIRRFSGGGTVLVDPDTLFFTFICNTSCSKVPCYPSYVFGWSERIWNPVFNDVGFQLRENDYVIGDKKFGGNAQYMRNERWLHHSSFLWDFDEKAMNYLLNPQKMPNYRLSRPHSEFLCKLKDFYPDKSLLQGRLITSLSNEFNIVNVSLQEVTPLLRQHHRKSTSYVTFE